MLVVFDYTDDIYGEAVWLQILSEWGEKSIVYNFT